MTRHPDEPPGPEQLARHADADRIEWQMYTVGAGGDGHIEAIVHDQRRAGTRANPAQPKRQLMELARRQIFFTELQCNRSGRRSAQRSFARRDEVAALHDVPISNQVQSKADARARRQGAPTL